MDKVAELAADFTPISEMAALLEVDEVDLRVAIADEANALHKAYHKAKAETMLKIRQTEIKLAHAGSPLAMQLVKDYINKMEDNE